MTALSHSRRLAATAAGLLAAACSPPEPSPWLINETPSLPRGLYRSLPGASKLGDIVALRPPAAARGYLAGLDAPSDARLLKRVVAAQGDTVCRDGLRMTWPQGSVWAQARDRQGRPLPGWRGCRRLGEGERLVLGDTAISFDSRYFGPVGTAEIDGVYQEVWRW